MSKIVGVLFVLLGIFVFAVAVLGLYRFHYTLNRMHAAALADTLGTALVMIGLMILGLDIFHILILFLIISLNFMETAAAVMTKLLWEELHGCMASLLR